MSWYKNSSVWSVVIAGLAIALSQFPPVSDWFPNFDLKIKYGDRLQLNNAIGLSGFNINLELENDGNTVVEVEKLELHVKEPSGAEKIYYAETLTTPKTTGGQVSLPVTSLELTPGERWAGNVFFNQIVSPGQEEEFNRIRLLVSKSITDRIQNTPWEEYNPRALVAADESVVKKALEFFEKNFSFEKGRHEARIVVKTRNNGDAVQPLEYTLYEFHFEMIRAQVADYKYGYGIYLPYLPNKVASVKVRPKNAIQPTAFSGG